MPKLSPDQHGSFRLPPDFLNRRRLDPSAEYWLDERDGDLILHPRRPDARKIFIEVDSKGDGRGLDVARKAYRASIDPGQPTAAHAEGDAGAT